VDGQTQPGPTDWLTVVIDDQVTVKLRGHAWVGDCPQWDCRFEAKVERYKVSQLSASPLALKNEKVLKTQFIRFSLISAARHLGAIMKLFDRDPDEQSSSRVLLAPMMALSQPDQALGLPKGTVLVPSIFLRNAGSGPAQVSATVDWRSPTASGSFVLPQLILARGEVKVIKLADYQKGGGISPDATWGTVKVAYSGKRADLIAVAVSYDKESRYGLQTPFSERSADCGRVGCGT
jgi:hypothetical protein